MPTVVAQTAQAAAGKSILAKTAGAAGAKSGFLTAMGHGLGIGVGFGFGLGAAVWGPILLLGGVGLALAIARQRRIGWEHAPGRRAPSPTWRP